MSSQKLVTLLSSQKKLRMLAFRVTGSGGAVIDEGTTDATLTDNGVGDWTLTFAVAFKRIPSILIGILTAQTMYQVSAVTTTSVRIKAFDGADGVTAKDAVFHVVAMGDMDPDQR